MAAEKRSIPRKIREALLRESGGKCANPGCGNSRVEIHHIRQWAIYKAHDSDHMIAVCPSCHDACHNGDFRISDDVLYKWKGLSVGEVNLNGHIYVPQAKLIKLSVGTVALQPDNERDVIVFEFSDKFKLSFSVKNNWLRVSAKFVDELGRVIFEVTDNNVSVNGYDGVVLESRPGKFRVTLPVEEFYLSAMALFLMRRAEPSYASDGRVIAIDLEVVKEGHVRVLGFWPRANSAIVITEKAINFCTSNCLNKPDQKPLMLCGDGDDSVFIFAGPIDAPVFGFR